MAPWLGEVLYWAATLVAILIIGVVAYAVLFGNGSGEPFLQGATAFVAIVIWLIGLSFRYVLARRKVNDR